ncbi:MAG: trehalose-phosphatase [Halofilum sp. (in: g-proteobacteria)]|nr:trehalose-phosphatase [Halofilum sp. (in: g-proteobacteria)]
MADLRATRRHSTSLVYAGSHGFEMAGPGFGETAASAHEAFLPALDAAEQELRERLAGVAGHLVERKPFDVSVHYRRVDEAEVAGVARIVDDVLAAYPRLRKGHGKKVFQVQPRIDWDKGRAVERLLERLGLDDADVRPIYIGDDRTDEDAFRALAGRGVAVAVRGPRGHDRGRLRARRPRRRRALPRAPVRGRGAHRMTCRQPREATP